MAENLNTGEDRLVTSNLITFSRVKSKYCTGYNIYAKENVNGMINEYLLTYIPNPLTHSVLDESQVFPYNPNQKWELPDDTIGDSAKTIQVSVNGCELNINNFSYDPNIKTVYVHIKLCKNDYVKITYKVDRIKYIHNTTNACEYYVVPIYDKHYSIGQHTII